MKYEVALLSKQQQKKVHSFEGHRGLLWNSLGEGFLCSNMKLKQLEWQQKLAFIWSFCVTLEIN